MHCTRCGAEVSGKFCPACGAPAAAAVALATPTISSSDSLLAPQPPPVTGLHGGAPVSLNYATWANRVIAYLIDTALVVAVMVALVLAGSVLGLAASSLDAIGQTGGGFAGSYCCCFLLLFPVAQVIAGIYNRIILPSQRGYSIGQGVVKLKMVDGYGRLLTQGTLWIRLLAQVGLGLVPFGSVLDLLWPLWDERRQTLHDKAVGSYVINNPGAL
jgi:uncharacterized RDD family membrane protein YckC